MQRVSLIITAMFFVAINAGGAEADPKSWSQKMREFSTLVPELLKDVSNAQRFHDPKNQGRIKSKIKDLSSLAEKVAEHHEKKLPQGPKDADPTIGFISSMFQEETERAYDAFVEGHRSYARAVLLSVTNYCIACHTRDASGPHYMPFDLKGADKDLTPYEKADLYAATRQFDRALEQYSAIIENTQLAHERPLEWEKAVRKALSISVRVKNDPKHAMALAQRVVDTPTAALFFRTEAIGWVDSLRKWTREGTKKSGSARARLNEADRLIKQGQKAQQFPADALGDMYYLRASATVHELLKQKLTPAQTAEAFYLAGIAYESLRDFGMWTLPETYYESCIHVAPHSALAEKCYRRYEKSVYLGYSGSGGYAIPKTIQRKLNRLKSQSTQDQKTRKQN